MGGARPIDSEALNGWYEVVWDANQSRECHPRVQVVYRQRPVEFLGISNFFGFENINQGRRYYNDPQNGRRFWVENVRSTYTFNAKLNQCLDGHCDRVLNQNFSASFAFTYLEEKKQTRMLVAHNAWMADSVKQVECLYTKL